MRKEADVLEAVPNPAAELVGGEIPGVGPINLDDPGGGLHQPIDELECGCFATPRASKEHEELATLYLKRQIIERQNDLVVCFCEILELDHSLDP